MIPNKKLEIRSKVAIALNTQLTIEIRHDKIEPNPTWLKTILCLLPLDRLKSRPLLQIAFS